MSDTSVLLPSSGITVFSTEDNSRQVAEDLTKDWRFARVDINAVNGTLDDAILYYQEHTSPELLVIQTDVIDDGFTEKLGVLAENCSEGTDAIIIGPDNDVQLYRKLIHMGVSDYLVRPLETEVFSEVVAKTLINKLGVTGSRLIVMLGSKGGAGVSTLAQGLALGLSDIYKQKTLMIDAAGGWSSNTVALGLEPSTTLHEATKAALKNDQDSIERMILKVNERLSILATGGDVMLDPTVDRDGFEKLLNMVMTSHPVVLFDASGASPDLKKAALMMAHKVMLFATPGLFSLRTARVLLQEIKDIRDVSEDSEVANLISLMLNFKNIHGKQELSVKEIEDMMDQKLEGVIDFAPALFASIKGAGRKMTEETDGRLIIESMMKPLLSVIPGLSSSTEGSEKAAADEAGIGGLIKKLTGKT